MNTNMLSALAINNTMADRLRRNGMTCRLSNIGFLIDGARGRSLPRNWVT